MMTAGDRGLAAVVTTLMALVLVEVTTAQTAGELTAKGVDRTQAASPPAGVCPPFHLRDEDGNVINPVKDENADKPYSPKQTCGGCHDYEKITQGYHFMQGMGEKPTAEQAARCLWATTPGNFGGNWCSPAPLYRYLSPKKNESAATVDLTSFTFFTSPCGACHPGGGSAEYDREGKRYDRWMSHRQSGLSSGGDNNFDGDYHKARWSETGVLEADCLLCHMPGYDLEQRKKQLGAWNLRWAATAGSRLASIKGSVQAGEAVEVAYNKELFNPDGTVAPHIVREPRNEVCLSCHAQPSWKKRGANFSPRTDVHLRAGLKCVDCHPAGSSANDPRIAGKEEHQFGKGDDPGGLVRNDLDNTVVSCTDCHDTGRSGAPIAKHLWLPPLHLETIACQTCHIPERLVMPIEVQAGDVFNAVPKIDQPGKRLWTFYGPNWEFRNHYGYLNMMGYDDKPTERFRPKLVRYEGKIYPANQIHSAWPGIEIEGETALMQPKMSDVVKMWTSHRADPAGKYPELAKITDDTGDGVPEVNRPEEIDALVQSVGQMLDDIKYPMEKKRVVWVMDDRVYRSGSEYRTVEKRPWETSPYANVHKYSHDILPAKAALGSGGCTDCHSPGSEFFYAPALVHLFDETGQPVVEPQYRRLGLDGNMVTLTAYSQAYVKPGLYLLMLISSCALVALAGGVAVHWVFGNRRVPLVVRLIPLIVAGAAVVGVVFLFDQPELMEYMLPTPMWLDANHFLVAVGVMLVGLVALLWELRQWISDHGQFRSALGVMTALVLTLSLAAAAGAGILVFLKIPALDAITRASYTVFDAGLMVLLVAVIVTLLRGVTGQLRGNPGPAQADFGGLQ
jgi:hypothetical protein